MKHRFHFSSAILKVNCLLLLTYMTGIRSLVLGPLSEISGRSIIPQLSKLIFLVFNLTCGSARNLAELITLYLINWEVSHLFPYVYHTNISAAVLTKA